PLARPALAQEYPSRPIRLLVGFAAGGSTDVFARAIAPRLQALLGQPVVIENRPGAGGNIATEATARSAPDGYTLLLGTIGPLAINPTLYGNLSFDPLKDLTPVSLVGEVPNVLAVPVDRPFRSVADIIAAAKARPEALNFGSSGIGSAGHLAAEQLNLMAGIRTTHVPYRGGGALLPELIAGRVDYAFTTALN
ncbi:MAG: Bug family tripartite tricarboxylate transporter substrate binding protein, partial [Alphaproteobacteria bacterium]